MASLSLKHIYKVYPNGTKAVNDFNMEIEDKEFIVFVGPSGCGKSTTLRMIAGLEDISAGELKIGDLVVNDVEPKDRDIAMVFQNYALYPHMTVYENIAFGLRLRKMPREEVHERVTKAAEILGITDYLDKKPKEMSGGQRQRVSLGRAIVRSPKVMLLDEPLSNLDAKLRTQMRAEISKLHSQLNTTFIYVTHDQVEAMTMGTRIVVMKQGVVQQIDTPKNLYRYPGNKFVAGFIGTPQMNFFEGTLEKKGNNVVIKFKYCDAEVTVPESFFYKTRSTYLDGKTMVWIGLRAEDISLDPEKVKKSNAVVSIKVSHLEVLGNETLVYGDINMGGDGYIESSTRIIVASKDEVDYKAGDMVQVALDLDHLHLFDQETELSITPRIPENNYVDCTVKGGVLNFLGQKITLPPAIVCRDCTGELQIPVDSIGFNGDIPATIVGKEKINDKTLVSVEIQGRRLFALSETELDGDVKISVDLEKISVISENEYVFSAMPMKQSLVGTLKKSKKIVEENGKKRKAVNFVFDIAGVEYQATDEIVQKIVAATGVKKAFLSEYVFEFSPWDVKLSNEGISAEVIGIKDYGSEKFVVCKVGETDLYVKSDSDLSGMVKLSLDMDNVGITEKSRLIKII